jgi:hypothetical protein
MTKISSQMVNINFNLGYTINKIALTKVMNVPPFICKFTNANNQSSVKVRFPYMKYDKNKKQDKVAYHTLRVNKSGHVCHSGPDLESMKIVYYTFMRRIVLNEELIASKERHKQILKFGEEKCIPLEEYKRRLEAQRELKRELLDHKIETFDMSVE